MSNYIYPAPDTDFVNPRLLFQIFFEKKWFIVGVSILTFIFAMAYVLLRPSQYQATALLQIQHNTHSSLGSLSHVPDKSETDNTESASLQIALIRSKYILEEVIQSLGLDVSVNQKTHKIIKQPFGPVLKKLQEKLLITNLNDHDSTANKTSVLQLSLSGNHSDQVMQTLNQILLVTQKRDVERKKLEAQKSLEFLSQQLPIVQNSLQTAEEKLNQYRSASGKIDIKLQTQYLLTHLSDIDNQLESTHLKRMEMHQQYTQFHPFVIALDRKNKELLKQKHEILQQIKNLPVADQATESLKREVSAQRDLYMDLLNKIQEQKVITSGIISDIHILSPASFVETPAAVGWPTMSIVSLFCGALLGCIAVLIKLLLRPKISDLNWVDKNRQCSVG